MNLGVLLPVNNPFDTAYIRLKYIKFKRCKTLISSKPSVTNCIQKKILITFYVAYQGKEVSVAILKACAISLDVGVMGHAQFVISMDSWVIGSLLRMKIRLCGCQLRPGQHALPCLDFRKSCVIIGILFASS